MFDVSPDYYEHNRAWDELPTGSMIRLGFEEFARDAEFVGVTTEPGPRTITYRNAKGGLSKAGLTYFRGQEEAPRLPRGQHDFRMEAAR